MKLKKLSTKDFSCFKQHTPLFYVSEVKLKTSDELQWLASHLIRA